MVGRPTFLSFQTVAELYYGALGRNWGESRVRKIDARIAKAETVHSLAYARLRVVCEPAGHALAQREHTADRWIAATGIRLGLPVVSNDGIFVDVPALLLETARRP